MVGNQSFAIGQYPDDTKLGAEWMRDMLCVALSKVVCEMAGPDKNADLAEDVHNLMRASEKVMTAFAEGVEWTVDQRSAYVALCEAFQKAEANS